MQVGQPLHRVLLLIDPLDVGPVGAIAEAERQGAERRQPQADRSTVATASAAAAAPNTCAIQPLITCRIHRLKNGCVPAAAIAPATTPELTT